jgi:DNA-binding LacI/PurR family transcriptional regulator
MYEMGTLALQMLMNRMKNPDAPPNLSTFLPELVVRRTCGAQASVEQAQLSGGIEFGEPNV